MKYNNRNCKGICNESGCCNKTFTTIDSCFISMLPTAICNEFDFIFPTKGPGFHLDMIRNLSFHSDKHITCWQDTLCIQGTFINGMVVKGYMNLLAHAKNERMMIVSAYFLPGLHSHGWVNVMKWMRATVSAVSK